MAQSYDQIQKRIAELQKQADAVLAREVAGVVERIKAAISHYGLTPEQLFGKPASPLAKTSTKKSAAKKQGRLTYANGQGQEWSGWGKRPNWLREALAAGRRLEDFQVDSAGRPAQKKEHKSTRRPSSVKYSDGLGNSWTGRGPQPRWLKEAVAAGKTLDELRA